MTWKKRTDMISAAEALEVGWLCIEKKNSIDQY